MQIPIEDIIVKRRIRKDMGDISALMESFKRYGQISPIIINKQNVLVAGGRRLEAARSLGWRTVNAIICDAADTLALLELEVEENIQRRDFTQEEESEAMRTLYRLRHPGFFRRIWNAIRAFFRRVLGKGKI